MRSLTGDLGQFISCEPSLLCRLYFSQPQAICPTPRDPIRHTAIHPHCIVARCIWSFENDSRNTRRNSFRGLSRDYAQWFKGLRSYMVVHLNLHIVKGQNSTVSPNRVFVCKKNVVIVKIIISYSHLGVEVSYEFSSRWSSRGQWRHIYTSREHRTGGRTDATRCQKRSKFSTVNATVEPHTVLFKKYCADTYTSVAAFVLLFS